MYLAFVDCLLKSFDLRNSMDLDFFKLAPGEDPDVRQSNRAALGGAKRSGREDKGGHCGEPKKGHVCTVAGGGDVNKRARIGNLFSPPEVLSLAFWMLL